jgi:hypothetical protein
MRPVSVVRPSGRGASNQTEPFSVMRMGMSSYSAWTRRRSWVRQSGVISQPVSVFGTSTAAGSTRHGRPSWLSPAETTRRV